MAANPAQDWSHQDTHTSHADTVALAIGANPSETGTPVVNQEIGLPELVDLLTRHEERGPNPDDINDPAMKSAKNGPYFCTTMTASQRNAANAMPWRLFCLDFDGKQDSPDPETTRAFFSDTWHIGYTSHRYRPDNGKHRVVLLLDRAVDAKDYRALFDALEAILPYEPDNKLNHPDQPVFLPSCPIGADRLAWHNDGKVLCVDDLLRQHSGQQQRESRARQSYRPPADSVIAAFNSAHGLTQILEAHGYVRKGRRYLHPQSDSGIPGLSILGDGNICFSHSGDALGDGKVHDAFDVFMVLDHDGNLTKAVRAAAEMLGIAHQERQKADPKNDPWPEPKPVCTRLSPVLPFDTGLLPHTLRAWVADVAHRMDTPPDYAAVGAMVTLAGVVGSSIGVKPKRRDNWIVIPNLWGGIIGPPSRLKSPTLQEMLKPLGRLEHAQTELMSATSSKPMSAIDKARLQVLNSELKAALKAQSDSILNAGDDEDTVSKKRKPKNHRDITLIEREINALSGDEGDGHQQRRYRTNDASIEALHDLLSNNKRGILVFRDELAALVSGWERDGREQDRGFFLEAYNGYGSFPLDRIGRGHVVCDNMCVSILGGTQPDKLQRYLQQAIRGDNDGLLQRFQLLVYPDLKPYAGMIDDPPDTHARNAAFSVYQALADADFASLANTSEYDDYPFLKFDDAAQEVFFEWYDDLRTQKSDNPDYSPMLREFLAKQPKCFASLALLIHLADHAEAIRKSVETVENDQKPFFQVSSIPPISEDAALRAAGWCEYLESHAKRIYGMAQSLEMQAAEALASRIAKGGLREFMQDGFVVRDIYIKGWSLLSDPPTTKAACDELVAADWLRSEVIGAGCQQRGTTRYYINPRAIS
jgi:PAS domain-containing protein